MISVYFDLETSDTNPCGQILNAAFVAVDEDFQIIDKLYLEIKLNRLQLPRVGALLANRINILIHQEQALESERSGMKKIYDFIQNLISRNRKIILIGYNSSKFDIKFLRTSLIRNGIAPYFSGAIVYKDLLQAVRKLYISDQNFNSAQDSTGKISFKLEAITKEYDLLDGKQTHNSLDDVLLTIKLAEFLYNEFGFDINNFDAYEARNLNCGDLVYQANPNYELKSDARFITTASMLLDYDQKAALWVDLDKYSKGLGRSSINYVNCNTGSFYLTQLEITEDLENIAQAALLEFKNIKLNNFFNKTTCDIEQDIYRLDFKSIDLLANAIWRAQVNPVNQHSSIDLKTLLIRARLTEYLWGSEHDDWVKKKFKEYCNYRYGGEMMIKDPIYDQLAEFYPNYNQLLDEISVAQANLEGEDLEIANALEYYYRTSEVTTIGLVK